TAKKPCQTRSRRRISTSCASKVGEYINALLRSQLLGPARISASGLCRRVARETTLSRNFRGNDDLSVCGARQTILYKRLQQSIPDRARFDRALKADQADAVCVH